MDQLLKQVPTPQFMHDFFTAVDALDTAGFRAVLADNLVAVFGESVSHGPEEYVKNFLMVDADFVTKHTVLDVYQVGNAFVMHGKCDLTKKGAGPETTNHLAPLLNFFWVNDDNKIASHVVSFAPTAQQPGGYKS
jgi:hypothetical protein